MEWSQGYVQGMILGFLVVIVPNCFLRAT